MIVTSTASCVHNLVISTFFLIAGPIDTENIGEFYTQASCELAGRVLTEEAHFFRKFVCVASGNVRTEEYWGECSNG